MTITKNTSAKELVEKGEKNIPNREGCKYSSGFMTEKDMTKIALKLGITENELKEKFLEEAEKFSTKMHRPKTKKGNLPYGNCVFLKEGKCSIHDVRPIQCKIMDINENHDELNQWFDLNFFVNPKDAKSVREYACALKIRKPIQGGTLEEVVPDKKRLKEILDEAR
jgi:Fe-S-cluster containining protein